MSALCNLKEAIEEKLRSQQCIVDAVCGDEINPLTGEQRISIAEITPETVSSPPYLGFSIPRSPALVKDDPTCNCFKSQVVFYAVTHHSTTTTYLADQVACLFTTRPVGETQKWFFDFSTDCVINKFTKYIDRYPLRPRRNNHENDTYTELIECEVIWCSCPCSGEMCIEPPEQCMIQTGQDEYDIEDCDC